MPDSFAVDQSPAENHIAAALAVDGLPISCGFAEAGSKLFRGREPVRPKLRIAAGEVDRIRSAIGRLIGKRREERELGALTAPTLQHSGVGEAERLVARDGNPPTQNRQRRGCARSAQDRPARQAQNPVHMDACTDLAGAGSMTLSAIST